MRVPYIFQMKSETVCHVCDNKVAAYTPDFGLYLSRRQCAEVGVGFGMHKSNRFISYKISANELITAES